MSHTPGASAGSPIDDVFCALLPRLYRRAVLIAGGRQSAEDIVHEAYLKLAARPQRFLAHPEPYAYAFSALVSVARDTYRRDRRQVPVGDVDREAWATGAEEWDGGVGDRQARLETVRLLRGLTPRQAAVVVLVDLDGYTIDQAAEILRVHRGTAARHRERALGKLRTLVRAPQRAGSEREGAP
ncbi:RNA polymerase sigma factor [Streptomyces xinghaiensis]|uniref:RNA polymerase sigma factor n=1 Tax=Streptomyces xinghaiensis TaxID=1038928 RepID=UPI002E13BCA7|nr:RNA polymerase sigma factor [Streptomyces xinghaiensis]